MHYLLSSLYLLNICYVLTMGLYFLYSTVPWSFDLIFSTVLGYIRPDILSEGGVATARYRA
jgi:hypothetical protein